MLIAEFGYSFHFTSILDQTIKKLPLRAEFHKSAIKHEKLDIPNMIRKQMDFIMNIPKSNYDKSHRRNIARRYFAIHEVAAEITSNDFKLIYCPKVIKSYPVDMISAQNRFLLVQRKLVILCSILVILSLLSSTKY